MQRYGQVIQLRPEHEAEYIRYHAEVWPGVLETIAACGIRNYTIFLRRRVLFAYFEYHGNDFAADMARMAADPTTQEWWKLCQPCQVPLEDRAPGEWWAGMEEAFHAD